MARRLSLLVVAVALLASACSSGPSLTEYAEELEVLVTTMNRGMDENDLYLDSETQTVERIRTYATRRIELRTTFLTAFEDLKVPSEAEELQAAALEALRNLVESEQALFERATNTDDLNELSGLWDSPAGQAARAADAQAVAICQAAEAAINSTEERQALVGLPWVPSELQEVVNVAFGCTAEDRAGNS